MKFIQSKKLNIWLAIIVFLIILIIFTGIWLIYDSSKIIKYNEISKSGIQKFSKSDEVVLGAKGKVIVKCVDTTGKEIAASMTIEGVVGTEYKVDRPKIEGYLTYGNEPYQKSGNYQLQDIEVVFVYQSESANVEIDEEDNTITVKMKNEKESKEYNIRIITKDENDKIIKGVDYLITNSSDEIVRNGTVEGDSFVVGIVTIKEEGNDVYKVVEKENPYYEVLFGDSFEFEIDKKWNNASNQFDIDLIYDKELPGVNIEIIENEIVINVVNKKITSLPISKPSPTLEPILTSEPIPTLAPVSTSEPIKDEINVFDLSIDKYISKVKVENSKGVTEINRDISKKDNLLKIEVSAKDVNSTKLEVTYKVLVENIGNVEGYATKIVDYIPDDLKLLNNENWVMNDNTLIFDKLSDKVLKPGDKEELELTFEWKLNENKLGTRLNQVQITEYKNDLDIRDITPDNIGKAEMIVTIKTGRKQICILAILTTLIIIAIVIYREKRKIMKEGEVK